MRRARAMGWLGAWLVGAAVLGALGTGAVPANEDKDVPLVPLPRLPRDAKADKPPPAPIPTRVTNPPAPVPDDKRAAVTPESLYQQASKAYSALDSYIVRLQKREMVNNTMGANELLLLKFRRAPWSVYLKWLGKEGTGREVLFVKGKHEGKIHTLLAAGDIPLVPAGRRMALAPDNILVRSACRHPITEAGLGACLDRVGAVLQASSKGEKKLGSLKLVGPVARPELPAAAWALEHTLPPGADPTLPRGGKRMFFFDPDNHLPMLVFTRDERDREVEYYHYDRLQPSVKLDNDDFDPDRLWGKPNPAGGGRK